MKRLASVIALSVALLLVASGTVFAKGGGLTQADVEASGWSCFPGDIMIHCVHPLPDIDAWLAAFVAGELPSVPSLNFSLPNGERFLGTEILIRADLGDDDRPCRQGTEPDGTYEAPASLDFDGDGEAEYYSCHRNNELS
jgi:hypothetical protein